MIILIDTREQAELTFKHPYIEATEKIKLDIGDYGVKFKDGHIPNIFFERKSIPDLFGTMGKGYKRFKKRIEEAQQTSCTLFIIIEGNLSKVFKGTKYSTIEGVSLVKKLFTLWIRYGVQSIFVKDRAEMAEYITQFYLGVGREYMRKETI